MHRVELLLAEATGLPTEAESPRQRCSWAGLPALAVLLPLLSGFYRLFAKQLSTQWISTSQRSKCSRPDMADPARQQNYRTLLLFMEENTKDALHMNPEVNL